MSASAFDLTARRAARTRDARAVVDNIVAGAETLHAELASWPYRYLRTSQVEGVERQMFAMQALLVELRGHMP